MRHPLSGVPSPPGGIAGRDPRPRAQPLLPDALGARPWGPVRVIPLPSSEAPLRRPALVMVAQRVPHLAVQEAVEQRYREALQALVVFIVAGQWRGYGGREGGCNGIAPLPFTIITILLLDCSWPTTRTSIYL
jgi:uncharacterized membrane protein YtjA (UPF0391 family)